MHLTRNRRRGYMDSLLDTRKNILFLIFVVILISLISINAVPALPVSCSGIYCGMVGSSGKVITNNPHPAFYANFSPSTSNPRDSRAVSLTKIKNDISGNTVVPGTDFVFTKIDESLPYWVIWKAEFSQNLPTGYYTVFVYAISPGPNTWGKNLSFVIDRASPTVEPKDPPQGNFNGFIFNEQNQQTDTIELGKKVIIKAKVKDFDGGATDFISDTIVRGVNVTINGNTYSMKAIGGNIYELNLSGLNNGTYTTQFTAYDSLSDPSRGIGNINNTVNVNFMVKDTIPPGGPVIWSPPLFTRKGNAGDELTLYGYTGEKGYVLANVLQVGKDILEAEAAAEDGDMPNKKITLQTQFIVGGGYDNGDDKIYILDEDVSKINDANYIVFYNHNRTNFERYDIVSIADKIGSKTEITIEPALEQSVPVTVSPSSNIYITNTPTPAGYFYINLQLYEGQNNVLLVGYDEAGNEGAELLLTIGKDSAIPTLKRIIPEQPITNNNLTAVKVRINGTGSPINQSSIILKIDNMVKCNTDGWGTAPGCSLTCTGNLCDATFQTSLPYSEDQHIIKVTASDIIGNKMTDSELSFGINTGIATYPNIQFTNFQVYNENIYVKQDNTRITVSFYETVVVAEARIGGNLLTLIPGTTYQYDITGLTHGQHTFTITAHLPTGPDHPFTKQFSVDLLGPTITNNNVLNGANKEASEYINLSITVTDSTAVKSDTVLYSIEGTSISGPLAKQGETNIYKAAINPTLLGLSIGQRYTLRYTARDIFDYSAAPILDNFSVVDTSGPLITGERPTGVLTNKGNVIISANVSDLSGVNSVKFNINGYSVTASQQGTYYSYPAQPFMLKDETEGSNNLIIITANDTRGNQNTKSFSFIINTQAAQLQRTYLTNRTTERSFNSGDFLSINLHKFNKICAQFTLETGITSYSINTGSIISSPDSTATLKCYNIYNLPVNQERSYEITLNSDLGFQYTLEFTIDLTSPSLLLNSLPNATNQNKINISGTVIDNYGISAITVNGEPTNIVGNQFQKEINLVDGNNIILIFTTDLAGNINSTSRTILKDSMGPIQAILWPLPESTNKGAINLIGYLNESNVNIFVAVYNLSHGPSIAYPNYPDIRGRNSNLKAQFNLARGDIGTKRLVVPESAYSSILPGDFIQFSNHNLPYFRRYEVLDRNPDDAWDPFDDWEIFLKENLEEDVRENNIVYAYTDRYPRGWFNISVELYRGLNSISIVAYDSFNNLGEFLYKIISYDIIGPIVLEPYPTGVLSENNTVVRATLDGTGSDINQDSIKMDIKGPCNIFNLRVRQGLTFENNLVSFQIGSGYTCGGYNAYLTGIYIINLTASDMAGNTNSTSWNFEINPLVAAKPGLILEGNSLKVNEVWYTTEILPNIMDIIVNFSEDTTLNNFYLAKGATKYALDNYTPIPSRKFKFTPQTPLTEGDYIFKLNVTGTEPGSIPTTFYFNVTVDLSAPVFSNIQVPSSVQYNQGATIGLAAADQVGIDIVRIKVDNAFYNMHRYGDLFNISTQEITATDLKLKYNISFYANDSLGNEDHTVIYNLTLDDSTPPNIRILKPENNYTNKALNTIIIETDDFSYCNFSWFASFPENYVYMFESNNRIIHNYTFDLSSNPNWYKTNKTYYIKCDNIFQKSRTMSAPLVIDINPLAITNANSAKGSGYSDSKENTIIVETNKPAKCYYIDIYDSNKYNITTAYNILHTQTREFDNGMHRLYVDCIDMPGNTSINPSWINFTVDIYEPITILDSGPNDKIADSTPKLWVKLNKNAPCTFNDHPTTTSYSIVENRLVYVRYYNITTNLDDGIHIYEVVCEYTPQEVASTNIIFTLNTTPPNSPIIDLPVNNSYVKDSIQVNGTTDSGVDKVFIYLNNNEEGYFNVTNGRFEGTINISTKADGIYTLGLKAQFPQGEEFKSNASTRTIIKDTISVQPVLNSLPPRVGTSQIKLIGTAERDSQIFIYQTNISGSNGTNIATTVSNSTGNFNITVDILEKNNYFYAQSIDFNNNQFSIKSNEVSTYYDNEPPRIMVIKPSGIQNKVYDIEVRANATDDTIIATMAVYINRTNQSGDLFPYYYNETINSQKGTILRSVNFYQNGTYLINFTATDIFGHKSHNTTQFILDTDAPSEPIFNLRNAIINSSSPTLNFTFEEEVTIHSLTIPTTANASYYNKIFLFNTTNLADGTYNLEIVASKISGTGVKGTYPFSFIVDTIRPTITINNVKLITTDYLYFNANVSGSCSDEHLDKVYISYDTMGDWNASCVAGSYYLEIPLGTGRYHTITAKAIDLAGNSNSITQIAYTGSPEITITNIIGSGISFTQGQYAYKTNSNYIIVLGRYMDENLANISVTLNNNKLQSPKLTKYQINETDGQFELNITLDGAINQEFINNITIIANDTTSFEEKANITITKDLLGPQIIYFAPETYTTATKWPTINITTHERAESCWINYTAKTTSTTVTEQFSSDDNIHFSHTLDSMIDYNDDNSSKTQNIFIYCNDQFNNSASHTIQFTVDLNKPMVDSFSTYYGIPNGILLLPSAEGEKEYVITIFDRQQGTATNVLLRATTNELTRCVYSGSSSSQFKNYATYSTTHETNEISIYNSNHYYYNITCEDKAGTKTDVKVIKIEANSSFEAGKPRIQPIHPPINEVPVLSSWSIRFNGSITAPPGYSITGSRLGINQQTFDLGSGGLYNQLVTFTVDGNYSYYILAISSNSFENKTGRITIDTTPPGEPGVIIG